MLRAGGAPAVGPRGCFAAFVLPQRAVQKFGREHSSHRFAVECRARGGGRLVARGHSECFRCETRKKTKKAREQEVAAAKTASSCRPPVPPAPKPGE